MREYVQPHGQWGNDAADWTGTDEDYRRATREAQHEAGDALLNWASAYDLTDQEADAIANPTWAYPNLIIEGHFVVICARSGHGKTTVMLRVCADLAAAGYRVIYINADTSGGDAKPMRAYAVASGFQMLLPDLKIGKSMRDVVLNLRTMADAEGDLSGVVFIFDTLKKMVDVISKTAARELYGLLRKLTARGVTCVALAHTNKYNAADGSPIFEGTGDLRSDCDDLIYLIGDKQDDGTMLVSTKPDKERGSFEPISFRIDASRNVERVGYVDVLTEQAIQRQYEDDRDAIERVLDLLADGPKSQGAICEAAKTHGINRKRIRRVLHAYGSQNSHRQLWITERGFQNNALRYRLDDALRSVQ